MDPGKTRRCSSSPQHFRSEWLHCGETQFFPDSQAASLFFNTTSRFLSYIQSERSCGVASISCLHVVAGQVHLQSSDKASIEERTVGTDPGSVKKSIRFYRGEPDELMEERGDAQRRQADGRRPTCAKRTERRSKSWKGCRSG